MGTREAGGEAWPLLAVLSQPGVVVDDQGAIVFLNPRAEAFWGVSVEDVRGLSAWDALRLTAEDHALLDEWLGAMAAWVTDGIATTQVRTLAGDGRGHLLAVTGTRVTHLGRRYSQLLMREEGFDQVVSSPVPSLRDPITGLLLLAPGTAEYVQWNARHGVVVVFRVDALAEIQALHGASTRDAILSTMGRVLAEAAPAGTLAARWGADAILVLGQSAAGDAESIAERVKGRVVGEAAVPAVPRFDHGVVPFSPGRLTQGLHAALEVLDQRHGGLLRAKSGGRIVLTREGRAAMQGPGGEARAAAPGAFASNITTEFDGFFRQAFARSVEQAREFVAFVDPRPGSAVVEVGAGSGRITFDGGLAERIGSEGQLLVTDPSVAQLQVARQRATALGLGWLRFACAPVEALPVEAGTADLCLGAGFLHFTEPPEAIRAMSRVVRTGGRVGLFAGLRIDWPPAWRRILEPVDGAVREYGLTNDLFASRSQLETAFRDAGLTIERAEELTDRFDYHTADIALTCWRQIRFVPLMLRGLSPQVVAAVEEAFEARVREAWSRTPPEDLVLAFGAVSMVGYR